MSRSDLIPDNLKNLEILFVHSVHPLLEIFTINFYIPPQDIKIFNALKHNIQGWIMSMINNKPKALWIISGDFNSKKAPFKLLVPTTTPVYTFKRKRGDKIVSSITDWTLSLPTTQSSGENEMTDFSDHRTITSSFICETTSRPAQIIIPDKNKTFQHCIIAETNASCFQTFYHILSEMALSNPPVITRRVHIIQKNAHKESLASILGKIENDLFNGNAINAFKMIKNMTILNPQKRDGGIMNCVKSATNQLIVGHNEILKSCLHELDKIQKRVRYQPIHPKIDLPPITYNEVLSLQQKISSGMGIIFEYFSDTWFRETKRIDLINNLWNKATLKLVPNLGCARLIPLNKVWPAIPTAAQFRPITVLCPLFKWLESRFLAKLNDNLVENMMKEQTGFVPGIGTSVNFS